MLGRSDHSGAPARRAHAAALEHIRSDGAENITTELMQMGLYLTGQFDERWDSKKSVVKIPAADSPTLNKPEKTLA
mgnify:CR=1 FL=1